MIDLRLEAVSKYVVGTKLLDVGSDHAYLPIYLINNNQIESAVAGEIVKGPYENSISNIKGHNLEDVIEVRLGSGLSVIKDSEKFDTITICGMGGPLIASIIKDGVKYLNNTPRFVISSNIYGESVRRQMTNEGYSIVQEEINYYNDKFYELMVFDYGRKDYTDLEYKFGPVNLSERTDLFLLKLKKDKSHLEHIKKQIEASGKTNHKLKEITDEINLISQVINNEY
ncbi:tRNA (adenine(22)-N(1))-methyltransferase [Nosocomiicoccus ampullae]|uniref:tRNA (Adenine22-N1)-methyltransferase n=1 Tax=Nosocomiicoccus ampullae TaxID=489910 RepID=A0A9Q2CZW2_9STAP|nr:tRNA (adenine(22)-N(1))-methyltransferase TrmK [Nosocomiicoccus ampullae]MBB5176584.1 tRNA (adenine22-N1)-methyltransferase [Nosocomiicoccus ampullae]QYA47561.1 tRNA (adenine(22)-N(1))-methyltransferase TrmK [Nosocomiicoccus ampullae]